MKVFKGRTVIPGTARAEALVTHKGFNTLVSYKNSLLLPGRFGKNSDHDNQELYKKPMCNKAICLPQTIGSTTGGSIFYCVADKGIQPACLLFSKQIDSLAAAGVVLADVWTKNSIPTVDNLGDEFLNYVQTGMTVNINGDGTVTVE